MGNRSYPTCYSLALISAAFRSCSYSDFVLRSLRSFSMGGFLYYADTYYHFLTSNTKFLWLDIGTERSSEMDGIDRWWLARIWNRNCNLACKRVYGERP